MGTDRLHGRVCLTCFLTAWELSFIYASKDVENSEYITIYLTYLLTVSKMNINKIFKPTVPTFTSYKRIYSSVLWNKLHKLRHMSIALLLKKQAAKYISAGKQKKNLPHSLLKYHIHLDLMGTYRIYLMRASQQMPGQMVHLNGSNNWLKLIRKTFISQSYI